MKIREDSWQLKLVRFWEPQYVPKNLCRHFWAVVFSLIAPFAMLLGIGGVIVSLVMAFIHNWLATLLVLVGMSIVVGLAIFIASKLDNSKPREKKQKKEKTENLIFAFIGAKKAKICPMIEVVPSKGSKT